MRYIYQGAPAAPVARTEVVESVETVDSGVEVHMSAEQYDALIAMLGSPDQQPIPPDIAGVFQHRGPFTVICDPHVR